MVRASTHNRNSRRATGNKSNDATRTVSQVRSNSKTSKKGRRGQPKAQPENGATDQETKSESDENNLSDEYIGADSDSSDEGLVDSDGIDDFEPKSSSKKRKRATVSPKKGAVSPKKKRGRDQNKLDASEPEDDDDLDENQKVIGKVVEAPKTGHVPPGQISKNTLHFLRQLQNPECNNRTWFKLHEPVFRLAEKEWKAFIEEFTTLLTQTDPQIPVLPPNDVIHRIYRDIRFSNDKTPYKLGFSASFSRSGRKGIFAGFKAGGSFLAAGTWCPGKNELQTIRNHILRPQGAQRLRRVISASAFVKEFGKAKKEAGKRQNIFGMEDELKVAPKGVDKNHKDIDLLKCRSFAVVHKFTDTEVLSPEFKHALAHLTEVVRPFVHLLNDMMTVEAVPSDEEEGGLDNEDGDEVDEASDE